MLRRSFLAAAGAAVLRGAKMTSRERVDAALAGRDTDRLPFTLWYHFGLEKDGPVKHASATLDFQRRFHTDLVKVMSDFPFPKPQGDWWEVRQVSDPFPEQLKALTIIRDGLAGQKHFVETIFNPWNVAEKLSSKAEVQRMKTENPQRLLDALESIAKSEANHARRALEAGASGIFLAIANADDSILSQTDYRKFSEPFDHIVLDAARNASLNILHLHGDKVQLGEFYDSWPAAAIQYSAHGTGVPVSEVRKRYRGVLLAGIDERNFRKLSSKELHSQIERAREAAGRKFILAPGCSVPNDTTDAEIKRLVEAVDA
jgi:uroporphyrinogen decarboxylase